MEQEEKIIDPRATQAMPVIPAPDAAVEVPEPEQREFQPAETVKPTTMHGRLEALEEALGARMGSLSDGGDLARRLSNLEARVTKLENAGQPVQSKA